MVASCLVVLAQDVIKQHSPQAATLVDTVGVGDAFSAVVIYGLALDRNSSLDGYALRG